MGESDGRRASGFQAGLRRLDERFLGPAGGPPNCERRSLSRRLLVGPRQPPYVRAAALATGGLLLLLLLFAGTDAALLGFPILFGALLVFTFRAERKQRLRWQADRAKPDG